jgi:hypothetical protein
MFFRIKGEGTEIIAEIWLDSATADGCVKKETGRGHRNARLLEKNSNSGEKSYLAGIYLLIISFSVFEPERVVMFNK